MQTFFRVVMLALLGLGLSATAKSQVPVADTARVVDIMAVNQIARKLIAPCCWSETADAHRSEAAVQMRAQIRTAMQRGFTEEQILAAFVQEYGEQVLSTPKAEGFNYMAWIMPSLALVLGLGVAWRFIRQSHQQSENAKEPRRPTSAVDDAYAARMEEELKSYL